MEDHLETIDSQLRRAEIPLPGASGQGLRVRRPIMERGRIEIRAVRPDQGLDLGIDPHLIENRQVPQRAEKLAGKHRLKVDDLFGGIVKFHAQGIGGFDLERPDAVQWVFHREWFRHQRIIPREDMPQHGHIKPLTTHKGGPGIPSCFFAGPGVQSPGPPSLLRDWSSRRSATKQWSDGNRGDFV